MTAAVLWLHGFGAGPDDFAGLGRALGRVTLRWLLPAAPLRPIRLYGGQQATAWYDLVAPFGAAERAHLPDVEATAVDLMALLAAEGVAPEALIVGGFSQGAAMAMALTHRMPRPPAGLVALSGYPVGLPWPRAALPTRALVSHGLRDDVVPVAAGRAAAAALQTQGHAVQWVEHPGGHELHHRQLASLRAFFAEVLPETDAGRA